MGGSGESKKGERINVSRAGLGRGIQSGQVLLEHVYECSAMSCESVMLWFIKLEADRVQGKVTMHVDEEGTSPEMPLGDSLLAFRVQAMPGGFTRFSYRTATGDEDRQVIDVSEVLEKTMSTSESEHLSNEQGLD